MRFHKPAVLFNASVIIAGIYSSLFITAAPSEKYVKKYDSIVADQGDSHVLASAAELEADFLISLDKKHILVLKNKIKEFIIVSPKELTEKLRRK